MFYIFHGQDQYRKQEAIQKLLGKWGDAELLSLNITKLQGKGLALADLFTACQAMPFLSKYRVVMVDRYLEHHGRKEFLDPLVEFLAEQQPDFLRLIFIEKKEIKSTHKLQKLIQSTKKIGYSKSFDLLKGNAVDKWIKQAVADRGGVISPAAVQLLSSYASGDLQTLHNEVEKLVLYKGEQRITPSDVQIMTPDSAEVDIFSLVDALGNRNGRVALSLFQQMLDDGEDPFRIFPMIIRQIRLLLQVKECQDLKMDANLVAKEVGMHPYVAQKMYKQARSFSLRQLESVYRRMLEIDVEVKTGKNDLVTAITLLIAAVTSNR